MEEVGSSRWEVRLSTPLFISKDHAVFVWLQEIEKYNAVQPFHCSMLRSHFTSARLALAFTTKNGKFATQKRELAI